MCCTRLAIQLTQKMTQKWGTIAQLCRAESSQLRHVSTIEKNLLSSSISATGPHNMANFGLSAAEIGSGVWSIRINFNRFRVLASLLQRRRSPEANQTVHDVWPSPKLLQVLLSPIYWQHYCTALQQRG